jgi:flagellar hook protein FlgE
MSSFSTSLSGLDAEEQALSVISNDLSNLNTTAFKSGTPVFSDLFYQMLGTDGAGDPVQVGVGSTMSSVDAPFTQGDVSSTGVPTDVAIQGNGLFILDNGNTQVYARAGNFILNSQGNLVDSNGNDVMGYPAVNGVVNTSQSLAPIVISSGQTFPPNATSTVQLNLNLDASDTALASATGALTVPAPALPTAGQTATIGDTTYTFATAITAQSPADTVLIGSDVQSTLANLAGAINASSAGGQAAGTTYSLGTVANPLVTATGSTENTLSLQAVESGTGGDALITSTGWMAGSFAAGDLSGGVSEQSATGTLSVPPPLPTAGQTVTVGGTTYTFASAITAQSAANTVLIGSDITSVLANLAGAINASSSGGQAAGTTYSSGTVANTSVTATGSTGDTLSLQALQSGVVGNSYAIASTWSAGSFGGGDLSGGVAAESATGTLTANTLPTAGQTVTVGGTTYTFANSVTSESPADSVLIGLDVQSTLANLAGAINASSTDGQAAGTTYSTGTEANNLATATGSAQTTLSLEATQSGTGGNSVTTATDWSNGSFGGAALAGGANATSASGTLAVAIPLPTAGQTVTVGGTTYTFASSITDQSGPDTVLIGADVQSTLNNLAGAINAASTGGQAAGTTYSSGTLQNSSATATVSSESTLTVTSAAMGAAGNNSTATSTDWTGGSFGTGKLAGGVSAQAATATYTVPVSLPTAGQTVTIGGTTYTFASAITPENASDTVLIGADVPSTLANLAGAINAASTGGQAAGITYSFGTLANTSVTATGSSDTTVALQAIESGSAGNALATTSDWTAASFGAADLSGGTDAGTFSTPITVYDSLGDSHVLTFNFTKSSSGVWNYQITVPAADVGATGDPQVVKSGTLQFGPDGNLISPPADVQGIAIGGWADGAKTMTLNWQLFSSPGTGVITQTSEPSASSGANQDGFSSGTLQSYSIGSSGVIDGVLSNGQTVALGQIALATFANYDGLTNLGSNDYQTSLASGAASVAAPGTGGSGTLDGSSLEASNVDIATALTQLIEAERGYEANAKAITTADDVMQASINLIQQ